MVFFTTLLSACNINSPHKKDNEATVTKNIEKNSATSEVDTLKVSNDLLPKWVSKPNKVTYPIEIKSINNEIYSVTGSCKPHSCSNDFMITLSNKEKEASIVVSVLDVDGAINKPSDYATYWFIGSPDKTLKEALIKELKANPNWN